MLLPSRYKGCYCLAGRRRLRPRDGWMDWQGGRGHNEIVFASPARRQPSCFSLAWHWVVDFQAVGVPVHRHPYSSHTHPFYPLMTVKLCGWANCDFPRGFLSSNYLDRAGKSTPACAFDSVPAAPKPLSTQQEDVPSFPHYPPQ